MTRYPWSIDQLVRRSGEAYRARPGKRLWPSHERALSDIAACRTAASGGHRYRCAACDETFWVYHGCGNRACPACHGRATRAWLAQREAQILPCDYFHLVATVPAPLRGVFRLDQKAMYGLFMKIVARSVIDLARDPRFVGGTPGILMVLHTWTGALFYHPHVHLLVTAGGTTGDGQYWREPRSPDYLVPVRALSKMIRHRFSEALAKRKPEVHASLHPRTWLKGWNTFCKPYGDGGQAVLRYLARYVFRIAINNARIVDMDEGHITFRHRVHRELDEGGEDRSAPRWRRCRLDDGTFLDRFLQHVLPKGFHKVRYYGLWHHSKKAQRQALRLLRTDASVAQAPTAESAPAGRETETLVVAPEPAEPEPGFQPTCPYCGCERVIHLGELKRPNRFLASCRKRDGP